MNNIFLERFKELGLTYTELGKKLGAHKATAFIYINNPARSGIEKSLEVGNILGFSEEEIKTFWTKIKQAASLEKIKSKL
jgi:plasmid maintenance system antidote protein VapI